MSSAQARVWYVDEVAGGDAPNNLCFGLRLEGALDCAALELALHYVVNRHETLRTTFDLHEGEFVQIIHPVLRPVLGISACSEQEAYVCAMQSAREPFDLRRGPLLRSSSPYLAALPGCGRHGAPHRGRRLVARTFHRRTG
jgi:hypothetical protein